MVISCAAVNCTNRQGKVDKTEVSFHRFPIKNASRLAKWKRAVRRENWMPNKYSFLCSQHFTPDSFLPGCEDQHRQLKAGAVPSIFDFSPVDKGTRGSLRKKMLSAQEPEDEEEEAYKRPTQSHRGQSKAIRISSLPGYSSHAGAVISGPDTNPMAPGGLPPQPLSQQTVGEWSLDGEQEVFKPSSCDLIDALHSYSSTSRQERGRCRHWGSPGREACAKPGERAPLTARPTGPRYRAVTQRRHRAVLQIRRFRRRLGLPTEAPVNPAIAPLDWLLGSWESDEPGEGSFPTIAPFRYTETLHFSQVGQPVINFMFNAYHAESKKPLHRECGFIRIQPGTNRVAFIIAQNSGLVEIEEGELAGQLLSLQSQALARTSFAKEPHVQQISRLFQLRADGKLEQTVSMMTGDQPLTQHLHITYRRSS
ncbi:THAP domain-containing protein 4 isoform X1 [Brienomyrus brachyistius]|uniref:THAP domain-containing protein 4 isoform X1 n=1 Tax=Brienomyrus brachyistius TaxID=42636 RepID=UPI0020B320F9|nr:THAP domain-containing protein 4 isoform X1 [Brienomyrus brachyistius]